MKIIMIKSYQFVRKANIQSWIAIAISIGSLAVSVIALLRN